MKAERLRRLRGGLFGWKHKGGKVDIWVQGENIATVTDTFAFTFDVAQDVQFEVLNVVDLTFRAVDPEVSGSNPIVGRCALCRLVWGVSSTAVMLSVSLSLLRSDRLAGLDHRHYSGRVRPSSYWLAGP